MEDEKVSLSDSVLVKREVIALKPRLQSKNCLLSLLVYVIISLPIFKYPYLEGKPTVELTAMVVSNWLIAPSKFVVDTRFCWRNESFLIYWSIFSARSTGPPWNSWDL